MRDCPRFDRCSATVCPLDADWRERVYTKADRTCAWMLEAAKPNGEATIRGALPSRLAEQVLAAIAAVCTRHAHLRRRLEAASSQQSKRLSGHALAVAAWNRRGAR